MDNKAFGLTFLSIMASSLLFFGIANAGSFAVDHLLFGAEQFEDDTYIGMIDVSNMEMESAASVLAADFEERKQSTQLLVTYQDATQLFPIDDMHVLLDETMAQAENGQQNTVAFELPETKVRAFLAAQFPVADFSASDIEQISGKLQNALANGQSETRIDISDDSLTLDKVTVSESMFPHALKTEGADYVIAALNEVELAPNSEFSIIEFVGSINSWDVTDAELTQIASGIYSAALKTNLLIDERSIGSSQPILVPAGQEAIINRKLGIDLVLANPNNSTFNLKVAKSGDSLTTSIQAFPYMYEYTVQTGEETAVQPRLIKQYSAFVSAGKSIKETGSEGIRLEVVRSVSTRSGETQIEPVSTDFYPPVHRIEVYPLEKVRVETVTEGVAEESGDDVLIVEDPENPGFDMDGVAIVYDEDGNIVQRSQEDNLVVEDPRNPGFDLDGNPIVLDEDGRIVQPLERSGLIVEDPRNPGFDTGGNPIVLDEDGRIVQPPGGNGSIVEDPRNPGFDLDGNLIDFDENGKAAQKKTGPAAKPAKPETPADKPDAPDSEAGSNKKQEPVYDKGGNIINP